MGLFRVLAHQEMGLLASNPPSPPLQNPCVLFKILFRVAYPIAFEQEDRRGKRIHKEA
jgi:hypothetical protein